MLIIPVCQLVGYAHAVDIKLAWDSVAMADGYKLKMEFKRLEPDKLQYSG